VARLILGSSMLITAVLASLGVAIMRVNAHQGPGDAEPPDIFAVIGSGEPVLVSQMFLTSCASSEVTVSLIFPGPPRPGYNRIDEAPRLNARACELMPKAQLPLRSTCRWSTRCVAWYVAMEGACVTAARQQLLARVRVAVPLGGQPLGIWA